MPVFQLILTSDTINEGRIKINNAFSATTGLWSGSTGFQSLIHNNGAGNLASGDYAIATGSGNTASGDFSFSKGIGNLASGIASTAEGGISFIPALGGILFSGSSATNYGAHAEGFGTTASGVNSHSEGFRTIASGIAAHAQGAGARARGVASFAGGDSCDAFGSYSSAIGFQNSASGNSAHAEGGGTQATGDRSHAEGNTTQANNFASHAEGDDTIASGIASHSQGSYTRAIGDYSFAGGRGRFAFPTGQPIVAEGETSFAFYHQDAPATDFGARADYSAILGGRNHFIDSNSTSSAILGGDNNSMINSSVAIIIGGENNNFTNANGSIALGANSATIDNSSSAVIVGSGLIDSTSQGVLLQTNGNLLNSTFISMIENSFGSPGGVCEINNSAYCKISGRNFGGGTIKNQINDSENSAIYNSNNCIINNNSNRVFMVSSSNVATSLLVGDSQCLILGSGAGSPDPGNKTIRLQANGGNGIFEGGTSLGPADYAEFFEWKDGNPNDEKRYGYFVSLNEDKIEVGNYNLIGIVSVNPAIIADSAPFKWQKSFVTDEWGNKEYVTYKKYKIQVNSENNSNNEEEEIIVSARTINAEEEIFTGETSSNNNIENYIEIYFDEKNNVYSVLPGLGDILGTLYTGDTTNKIFIEDVSYPKINPEYDPSQIYTPREERPEWSPIGLLGKLHVRTAESITGSTVSANSDGIAINGSDYHVLKQIMDFNEDKGYGVVQILFK